MAYSVIVQDTAQLDATDYAAWIIKQSGGATGPAERWLSGLENLIDTLSEMPTRFRVVDEQEDFDIPLRQVVYFSHRVIFHASEETQTVHVLRVYHGAKKALSETDVPELDF